MTKNVKVIMLWKLIETSTTHVINLKAKSYACKHYQSKV